MSARSSCDLENVARSKTLERETGIEPATNSLEGCDSTTELLPPFKSNCQLFAVRSRLPLTKMSSIYPFSKEKIRQVTRYDRKSRDQNKLLDFRGSRFSDQ